MKITIVNSGAPGTVALLAPFFLALAEMPEIELIVLEQSKDAIKAARRRPRQDGGLPYRLEYIPTHFYNRRHACMNIMKGGYRKSIAESRPEVIYILGEAGYLSSFQIVHFAKNLPRTRLGLFAAQNVYQKYPPPFPWIEHYVLQRIDHAFPLGQDHEDVLRSKGYRGPATQLPLGVDTELFRPAPAALDFGLPQPIVGYVGDFLPARNLPLLLEAISLCKVPVGLLIVGDGENRPLLEKLAHLKGLGGRIRFAGRIPHEEVPQYINCMDMLVLPSKPISNRLLGLFPIANAEQFGRVLVEAMACGKPVIGSSCGEIPHVIQNAGLVFPEGDAAALAALIQQLSHNRALRERLGENGLHLAKTQYDWRVIAHRMIASITASLAEQPELSLAAKR